MTLLLRQFSIVLVIIAASTSLAMGSPVFLGLDMSYSEYAPLGATPWVLLAFADTAPQEVKLQITNNLAPDEFLDGLHLNLVDEIPLDQLVITVSDQTGTFALPTISLERDAFKAGGDGFFDVLFSFARKNNDGARFGFGDSVTLTITGPVGFRLMSFNALSAPGGGAGPFLAAAHIQGIGESREASAWIAANPQGNPFLLPEPATVTMLALGGAGMLVRKRI